MQKATQCVVVPSSEPMRPCRSPPAPPAGSLSNLNARAPTKEKETDTSAVGLSVVARFIRVPVATQSRRRQQQQQQQHQRVLQLQACLKSQLCNCWSPRHTRPQSRHFPCYAFQGKSADPVIVWMETDASCQVGAACRGGGPAPAASSLECEGRGAERVEEWSFSRSTMCYYFGIMLEWTQTSRFFFAR
jgi:hypothetical protein